VVAAPTPEASALERLPPDDWAWLLTHLRASLHALDDDEVTPEIERLRAAPASRLAGGRTRRDAARLVARGGALWRDLHERVAAATDRPPGLDPMVAGEPLVPGPPPPSVRPDGADARDVEREAELDRVRERARQLKRERDEARRQLEGAEVRAAAAEARVAEADRRLAELAAAEASAREAVASADAERDAAVERERRRAATERRALEEELAAVRRELHELRDAASRRRAAPEAPATRPAAPQRQRPDRASADPGVVVGRPTRLPPQIGAGTREAAEALLGRGRLAYVDGYNVTRTQRDDLDLEGQRRWLVGSLATLVARTGVEPTVWFDSTVAGPSGRQERARNVRVRFTEHGLSADDEIVFAVEALERDRPVVVVTDDRGLRSRLAPYGVDLLGTASFRWMLD
jgi:hypothetical protein